jgi:protein-S-isoprenylcysteine O-methyltransferase Ste14
MSLIPAFEIGVWNIWIFAVPFILANVITVLINKNLYKKISPDSVPTSRLKKNVDDPITGIFILSLIYSIFIPLKLETTWFYAGLIISVLGIILFTTATLIFVTTPFDEPIARGLYKYSRHPQYIAMPLMFIGMGIASASWVFLLIAIVFSLDLIFIRVSQEERYCLEKYGDAYRDYMKRTPRWIGIPKAG